MQDLSQFRKDLSRRAANQKWYELQQPAVSLLPLLRTPKIVYPIIANECRFALDEDGFLINDKAFVLPTNDLAVLGVLNSKLAFFYFSVVCAALEGGADRYLEFRAQYVRKFPMARIGDAPRISDRIRALVSFLGEARRKATKMISEGEEDYVLGRIAHAEKQIDTLVYELYGLSAEEIGVIERSILPKRGSEDVTEETLNSRA